MIKAILFCLFLTAVVIFSIGSQASSGKEMKALFLDLYHNRLVAEGYIYKLNTHFNQKKIDLTEQNLKKEPFNYLSHNDSIANLLLSYSKTKLTQEEENIFESLKLHITQAKELELSLTDQGLRTFNLAASYDNVLFNLNALSSLQLKEAGNLFKEADKNSSMSLVESELFWALGIVVLLIIIGILKSDNTSSSSEQSYSLN
ncbi:MAG: hypothetical protein ABIP40_09610 [Bacteroidia bacterium]